MKICIAQTKPIKGNVSANIEAHIRFIKLENNRYQWLLQKTNTDSSFKNLHETVKHVTIFYLYVKTKYL